MTVSVIPTGTVPPPANPVWVVDDSAAVAESLTLLLNTEGIPAVPLLSSDYVLDRLANGETPSVLIQDVKMPCNGGNKILSVLAQHPEWTFPVIILSGYSEAVKPELLERVYVTLVKPVDPIQLLAHLRRALAGEPKTPPVTTAAS